MTGDTAKASGSKSITARPGVRAYWDNKSGGKVTMTKTVTLENRSGQGKWMTRYFGYFGGVGRSSSLLESYHHTFYSSLKITRRDISTESLVLPAATVVPGVGVAKDYSTIEEAVTAFNGAGEGAKLTLKSSVGSRYGRVTLSNSNGTVDLNGNTWSEKHFTIADGADIAFCNGTLSGLEGTNFIDVKRGGQLKLWNQTNTGTETAVKVTTSKDAAKRGSGSAAINAQGFVAVREGATIDTDAPSAIALSGEGARVSLQNDIRFQGNRTADIRLSQGAKVSATENNKQGSVPPYTLTIDETPTAVAPIAISSNIYKADPTTWFTLTGKPGCQIDQQNNTTIIRLVKVTLNPAGGTIPGATADNGKMTLTVNAAGKLSPLPTATKYGQTLQGWYDAPLNDATGKPVTVNTVFNSDSNIYARYDNAAYTVTFDANDGTVSPTSK